MTDDRLTSRVPEASGPVFVIGNNTIDYVFRISGALPPDGKTQAESLRVYPGGQAANVAYALSMLGRSVHYVGSFGDDAASSLSRESLRVAGVRMTGCMSVRNCHAHHAAVFVDTRDGRRTIVMHKDPRLRLGAETIRPEFVERAALVYIDNHEEEASLAAAGLARAMRIPVVADLEVVSGSTESILAYVDVLIAPMSVLSRLAGCTEPFDVLRGVQQLGPSAVVATVGADGAFGVESHNEPVRTPGVACTVRDSTGAGDAFHAGYIAAWLDGLDFADRLRAAAVLASSKCAVDGPRVTRDCVDAALSTRPLPETGSTARA